MAAIETGSQQRRKVCVFVTARASYSRIRSTLAAIERSDSLELQLVAAASAVLRRYGDAVTFMRQDGFQVAAEIHSIIEGESPMTSAKTTGLGLIEAATVLENLAPDIVVSVADRFETMATAIAAAYMHIPLAHVQGGEITGSIDEKVRHSITKLADIHLVSNQKAADRVISMGEAPDQVFVTGCPSIDLAAEIVKSPELDFDLFERYGGVGPNLDLSEGYVMVLQHPVTSQHAEARAQVTETLKAIHRINKPTLWFWPNVDAGSDGVSSGIRKYREQHQPQNIHFFRHVDSLDFLRLALRAKCVIGNSSVAIRECSYLGTPAVNIGDRQLGRDRGANVLDVGHDASQIELAIRNHLRHGAYRSDPLYGDGQAGERIAEHLSTVPLRVEKRLQFPAPAAAVLCRRVG